MLPQGLELVTELLPGETPAFLLGIHPKSPAVVISRQSAVVMLAI